jgi:hypothetical protein
LKPQPPTLYPYTMYLVYAQIKRRLCRGNARLPSSIFETSVCTRLLRNRLADCTYLYLCPTLLSVTLSRSLLPARWHALSLTRYALPPSLLPNNYLSLTMHPPPSPSSACGRSVGRSVAFLTLVVFCLYPCPFGSAPNALHVAHSSAFSSACKIVSTWHTCTGMVRGRLKSVGHLRNGLRSNRAKRHGTAGA